SITPFPQTAALGSIRQMSEQPSPASAFRSSHVSGPTIRPSPQNGTQRRPGIGQVHPGSIMPQSAAQPSPPVRLPSSQISDEPSRRSPHTPWTVMHGVGPPHEPQIELQGIWQSAVQPSPGVRLPSSHSSPGSSFPSPQNRPGGSTMILSGPVSTTTDVSPPRSTAPSAPGPLITPASWWGSSARALHPIAIAASTRAKRLSDDIVTPPYKIGGKHITGGICGRTGRRYRTAHAQTLDRPARVRSVLLLESVRYGAVRGRLRRQGRPRLHGEGQAAVRQVQEGRRVSGPEGAGCRRVSGSEGAGRRCLPGQVRQVEDGRRVPGREDPDGDGVPRSEDQVRERVSGFAVTFV